MAAPAISSLSPAEKAARITVAEVATQAAVKEEARRGITQGQAERVDATTRPCRLTTKCPECHTKFYSKFNLARHMRTRHQGPAKKPTHNKELQQGPARKGTESKTEKMADALADHAFVKKTALNPYQLFSIDLWLDPLKGVYFCTLVPKSL
jgi:hypothetical protein